MIGGLTNGEAIPVLERVMQFAGARHRLIAHNIANIDTPGFRPVDLSVEAFQARLGQAIDRQRAGDTAMEEAGTLRRASGMRPAPSGENILFHDQNDRDLERITQDMVENFMVFRAAAEFLRGQFDLIDTAIRERI